MSRTETGHAGSPGRPDAGRDGILTAIALFKFCKAALLVAIGLGALDLLRPGVTGLARQLLSALASNLGPRTVQQTVARVSGLSRARLKTLGVGAFLYAAVYTVEGIGLWRAKRWAEYLTVGVTASFVPFEVYELVKEVTLPRVSALSLNVAVVAYLGYRLRRTHELERTLVMDRWHLGLRRMDHMERTLAGFPGATCRRWGTTPDECARPFPCDRYVRGADDAYYRGIDVAAPPATLFRWLCQLRVAPYSHDWIDNLGRQSPQELISGLPKLQVGQRFMDTFDLVEFEPDRALTLLLQRGRWAFGEVAVSYVIEPVVGGPARLLVKVALRYPRLRAPLYRLVGPGLDLVMMRRQLVNLKRLSEESARGSRPSPGGAAPRSSR